MIKPYLTVSTLALSATLLCVSSFDGGAKAIASTSFQPRTAWAVTMIEGDVPENGYCALARQYDQGLVLTLGQSARDEYSLAIDFQNKKLNPNTAYKVELQTATGQGRTYDVLPASEQAMVVRLGYDVEFLKSIENSNQLEVGIDDQGYQFSLNDFKKGRAQLKTCIAGLTGEDAVKTAGVFSAEKIENAPLLKSEPKNVIKKQDIVVEVPPPIVVPAKAIKMARVDTKIVEPAVRKIEQKVIVAPDPIVIKRKQPKQKITQLNVPEMTPPKQRKNTRVSLDPNAGNRGSARPQSVSVQSKKYGSQPVATIKIPNKSNQSTIASVGDVVNSSDVVRGVSAPVEKTTPQPVNKKIKVAALDMEPLTDESKFPKPFSRKALEAKAKNEAPRLPKKSQVDGVSAVKTNSVKEPPILLPKTQQKKLTETPVIPNVPIVDTKSKKELAKVQSQLAELEKENRALYLEARQARGAIDSAVVDTGNEALKKIRTYEKKLEAARSDNLILSKKLEEMHRLNEDKQVAVAGNADAQQSMRRYNEAQREIKRLGLLLEQQRLSHRQEKTELEGMLFDPAVTDKAQRRKLSDLEAKLAEAEKRFQVEAQKVNKVNPETANKLKELERKLAISQQKELALKAEEQKVKIEAQRLAAAQVKVAAITQKEAALKLKEARLLAESKKLANASATLVQAQVKEKELRATEARIKTEAKKIAAAEIKLEQARRREVELKTAHANIRRETQQIAVAQQRLNTQNRQGYPIAANSIAPKSPMRVFAPSASAPRPLKPSAQNIKSNPVRSMTPPVFGKVNLQKLLQQSGLSSISTVVQQSSGHYAWNAAGLSGKAEVVPVQKNLTQFAQNYIAKEKRNCRGDFASLPARVPGGSQGYDLACIGASGGKSSSVIFAKKDGSLVAITHETSADNMDSAIDARDKIASRL